jgi:hypothetical protein
MTRSGISLRLSGQGSGIGEKWRFILEPAGGSLITQTKSGKWHQNYDNDAGRGATQFYIDAVQVNRVMTRRSCTTPMRSSPAPRRCCSARRG